MAVIPQVVLPHGGYQNLIVCKQNIVEGSA